MDPGQGLPCVLVLRSRLPQEPPMARTTNPTDAAPLPPGPFSQHARVGNVVAVAGQVGITADGSVLDDVAKQTAQALRNVMAVLDAAGASEAHIISLRVFLT